MKEQQKLIHLALAFDKGYITPFYVLLTSIFHNNKANKLAIHTIATGIDQQEKERLISYVNQNKGDIYFYEINEDLTSNLIIPANSHFTVATYYRLFFPTLVPKEITKLIYIDVDTVVIGDLAELYNTIIDSVPIAAVEEPGNLIRPDLGLNESNKYFNAGVLLINVILWKDQDITKKAITFLSKYPERIKFADQDALNAVLIDNWFELNKKYNLTYSDVLPGNLPTKYKFSSFLKDIVIIHYSTNHKPWLGLGANRFRYIYHTYLRMSPHVNQKKYIDFKLKSDYLFRFIKIRLIEFCFDHPIIVKIWRELK